MAFPSVDTDKNKILKSFWSKMREISLPKSYSHKLILALGLETKLVGFYVSINVLPEASVVVPDVVPEDTTKGDSGDSLN